MIHGDFLNFESDLGVEMSFELILRFESGFEAPKAENSPEWKRI